MHVIQLHHGDRKFSAWCNRETVAPGTFDRLFILMHGFPDNRDSFLQLVPVLETHFGPNVLIVAPALRGYEKSSQDNNYDYSVSSLAQDVRLWILELNPDQRTPVHLVGHDWGAVVAFKTASEYPELITLMVTLAIPYLTNLRWWQYLWYAPLQVWCSSYMLRMQSALFYRAKFGDLLAPGYLDELWAHWSPGWDFSAEIDSVRCTLALVGVLDHATGYYRSIAAVENLRHLKWDVDFEQVPTLILGGVRDGCMLPALFELESRILARVPKVKVQLVEGVGHFLHREDPNRVGKFVTLWFDKYR